MSGRAATAPVGSGRGRERATASLRLLTLAVFVLLTTGGGTTGAARSDAAPSRSDPGDSADRSDHSGHAGMEHHASPAPTDPVEGSIFQLDSRWTTAEGQRIPLSALGGRVQVLAMVYTHCEHACPRIVADMHRLRAELGDAGDRVGFALVSLDPRRDDAERLAEFARETGLDEGWTLLRAEEGAVRELAAVLGIRYRRVSEEDFVHSNLLSVLDPEGVVVHRQVGLGVDPRESAAIIRQLLTSPADEHETP